MARLLVFGYQLYTTHCINLSGEFVFVGLFLPVQLETEVHELL